MDDIYLIPEDSTEGFYKEKASKFHAYLYPVKSVEEVEHSLSEIKKIHPKARHICYAYRLAPKDQNFRVNDDGEPSGTAGKPIFNQILSAELHQVLVAVVRYFGGTKLGASGLIKAYKTVAEEACSKVNKLEKYESLPCKIQFDYAQMGDLINVIKQLDIDIIEKEFDMNPYIVVELRALIFEDLIKDIKSKLLGRPKEDIEDDTEIPNIIFEYS